MRPRLYRFLENDSGEPIITRDFYTNSTAFETFFFYAVPLNKSLQLKLDVLTNYGGDDFALFQRMGLFWNKGSGIQFRAGLQSNITDKTKPGFDVRYTVTSSYVLLEAKSFTANPTHWKATLRVMDIGG